MKKRERKGQGPLEERAKESVAQLITVSGP